MKIGTWFSSLGLLFLGNGGGEPSENVRLVEAAGTTVNDEDEGWRKLTGDNHRDLEPLTLARAREISAWLWQANLMANRIIELPLAFMLAEGVSLQVKDDEGQKVLDRFWRDPINAMDIRLPKMVRELALFGEQCYPAFVNEHSGRVRMGYLDPSLIETVVADPDNKGQPIGIVTKKDKKGRALRYKVILNGPDGELFSSRTQEIRSTFTDGECFYFNVNGLISGLRGRPDLTASADWLDAYDDFLFGETDRAKYLRAFVWDVELKGSSPEEVKKRAKEITPPGANSVRVHNDAEKWNAISPGLNAADTSETSRLLRNHVLGGATVPEHWFGGGGDVNRSTGESMGDPAFKIFSMRQRDVKHVLEEIARFVLRMKALADGGEEPDFAEQDFDPEAVFPEMMSRDTTRYAAALQQTVVAVAMALENNLISKPMAVRIIAAVAGRLGVEMNPEKELQTAQEEADKKSEADVFKNPLGADQDDAQA